MNHNQEYVGGIHRRTFLKSFMVGGIAVTVLPAELYAEGGPTPGTA